MSVPATTRFGQLVVWTGAERVALAERFYRKLFAGALAFVGVAALGALALLPVRSTVNAAAAPTIALTAILAIASPLAVRHATRVYLLLRGRQHWERACVLSAGALVAYPLESQLWWPACALLMLISISAPLLRTVAYCLAVLLANLLAHVIAADLSQTPAVNIIGLWVGLIFWPGVVGLSADRLASHILRLDVKPEPPRAPPPLSVNAVQHRQPADAPHPAGAGEQVIAPTLTQLTCRQLQVIALLADGMTYAAIAARLSIGADQVQRHVTNAVRRAGVSNRNELVVTAINEGLVPAVDAR